MSSGKYESKLGKLPRSLANRLDLSIEPIGFIFETECAISFLECDVALEDIKADAPLQFAQTDRAQMQRTSIAFSQMIRTIHQAIEIHAVGEAEHVTGFVR